MYSRSIKKFNTSSLRCKFRKGLCDNATCKYFSLREVTIETCQHIEANNRIQVYCNIFLTECTNDNRRKQIWYCIYSLIIKKKRETKLHHE